MVGASWGPCSASQVAQPFSPQVVCSSEWGDAWPDTQQIGAETPLMGEAQIQDAAQEEGRGISRTRNCDLSVRSTFARKIRGNLRKSQVSGGSKGGDGKVMKKKL